MTTLSLVPSNSLASATGNTQRSNRFILFTDSWLQLQEYVQTSLQLPVTTADFEKVYGGFDEGKLVANAVEAMRRLQALTSTFGDPRLLKQRIAKEPTYLFGATPPDEIYSHIVWLALQIQNVAGTFKYTLSNLGQLLGPQAGSPEQRAANLKEVLMGRGGLVALADSMRAKTAALIAKLTQFDSRVGEVNEQMARYTGQQSVILAAANRLVGQYTDDIEFKLKPAQDAAFKAWQKFTAAAVVASVGLVIAGCLTLIFAPVTFGASTVVGLGLGAAGVIAAGVLGAAAQKERDLYNAMIEQIAQTEVKKQQKVALVADLSAFNAKMALVGTGLADFGRNLSVIEGVWIDVGQRLSYLCGNYGVEQLSDLPWVTQAFSVGDAVDKWGDIAVTTREFSQNSLVQFDLARFGDRAVEPQAAAA